MSIRLLTFLSRVAYHETSNSLVVGCVDEDMGRLDDLSLCDTVTGTASQFGCSSTAESSGNPAVPRTPKKYEKMGHLIVIDPISNSSVKYGEIGR